MSDKESVELAERLVTHLLEGGYKGTVHLKEPLEKPQKGDLIRVGDHTLIVSQSERGITEARPMTMLERFMHRRKRKG